MKNVPGTKMTTPIGVHHMLHRHFIVVCCLRQVYTAFRLTWTMKYSIQHTAALHTAAPYSSVDRHNYDVEHSSARVINWNELTSRRSLVDLRASDLYRASQGCRVLIITSRCCSPVNRPPSTTPILDTIANVDCKQINKRLPTMAVYTRDRMSPYS